MGGPSILSNEYDLSLLSGKDHIIFLESKALTHRFLEYGVAPDYYMMFYPEKTRTNTLQHQFIQAISCKYELGASLKDEYRSEWYEFNKDFIKNVDKWQIGSPNKAFRIKKDIVLRNSPLSLIGKFPQMGMICYDKAFDEDGISSIKIPNKIYKYTHSEGISNNIDSYYNPEMINGTLTIDNIGSVNSAAIALYPILNYMGFSKIIFIGMDMSLLGSLEYSALFTFKSMKHYGKFFNVARQTFSYGFPRGLNKGLLHFGYTLYKDLSQFNYKSLFSYDKYRKLNWDIRGLNGKFMRDKNQYNDCEKLLNYIDIEFINIYEPFKYALPLPGIKNMTYEEYLLN